MCTRESRLAQETASKTDVMILVWPHNASTSPWSSTPSLQRSISLTEGGGRWRFSRREGRDHRSKVSWMGLGRSQVASLSHAAQELAVNDPRQPQLTQLVGYAYVRHPASP